MNAPIRVAVTGGAGQIGYSLLFRLVSGETFGPDQPVILQILEVPEAIDALRGVVMELEDCAYPLLHDVIATGDENVAFRDANWAILVGGKPRGKGMERADVIKDNAPIFVAQGRAINARAAGDIRVLVVANPCNTNALIAQKSAPDVPADRWLAMTRLDQNRARWYLAAKAGVPVTAVNKLAIWGNHSPTMLPDFEHAFINGLPASEVIKDQDWLQKNFVEFVQQRGKQVIDARGKSSAASAANAVVSHLQSQRQPTPENDWFSSGVLSDGNPYGIPEGLVFSFPLRAIGGGQVEIVQGLTLSSFARQQLEVTTNELLEERDAIADLLKSASTRR